MAKINVLDIETVNKIAAGEVVERPASVIKELVENSIDAGSDNIIVEIKNGGLSYIRITDNGCGIAYDEIETAFLPHSTSKIKSIDDLSNLYTMGFRGEALASISSVSRVDIISKTKEEDIGVSMSMEGGKIVSKEQAGCPDGTTIIVKDLFFNTPARMNFMKKDTTEYGHIKSVVERMIMGNPGVSLRLINNGREVLFSSGNNNRLDGFSAVFGRELASQMIEVSYEYEGIKVTGFVGIPYSSRPNRNFQNLYVNRRWVHSKTVTHAAEEAYKTMLMTGQYPVFLLNVEVAASKTDINVHPAKLEIKFSDERIIHSAVFWAVQNALLNSQKEKDVEKNEYKNIIESTPKKIENSGFVFARTKETGREDAPFEKHNSLSFKKNDESFTKEFVEIFKNHEKQEEEKPLFFEEVKEEVTEISENEDKSYKITGQIFDTYIIVEKEDKMLLIDQHAAHERINYEKLVEQKNIVRQVLMFPETITLSTKESTILTENKDVFLKMGFLIDEFGNNEFIIREIPENMLSDNVNEVIENIIGLVEKNSDPDEFINKALFTVACKSAIKANRELTEKEMKELVEKVLFDEKIRTCPHGRPIIISFSKKYIEKEFKRIV